MKRRTITVTEAAKNFADCVNRAHYQNVTFVLLKNACTVRPACARWREGLYWARSRSRPGQDQLV